MVDTIKKRQMADNLPSELQAFLEPHRGSRTWITYSSMARKFNRYLEAEKIDIKEIRPIHLDKWMSLTRDTYSHNTVVNWIRFLGSLLNYLYGRDQAKAFRKRWRWKEQVKFAVDLTPTEIKAVIDSASKWYYQLAYACMAYMGFRASDVLGLHKEDVDHIQQTVTLRKRQGAKYGPKGMRPEDPPTVEKISPLITPYISTLHLTGEGRLIPVSYSAMKKQFGKCTARANIKPRTYPLTMHKFRHFCGQTYYDLTKSERIVQTKLRHRTSQASAFYTQPRALDLDKAEQDFQNTVSRKLITSLHLT